MITGIERPNNKSLHLGRTVDVNRDESFGLPKTDTTQMLDHNVKDGNGVDSSFVSETPWKVMVAMSGFSGDDQWLAHRGWLNMFPETWTEKLFPCLALWEQERESDWGDKTKSSKVLLHTSLPHCGRVFAQYCECNNNFVICHWLTSLFTS